MSKNAKNISINSNSVKDELVYLTYFYLYLFQKRSKELLSLGLTNFIIGLFPIFLASISVIRKFDSCQMKNFFGDGSLIVFSIGVLVSFASFNFRFRKFKEAELNNILTNKSILYGISLLYYLATLYLYIEASTEVNRSWTFIFFINSISFVFLLISLFIVLFIKFSSEIDYQDVIDFKSDCEIKRMTKEAKNKTKSKDIEI